jgi:hypothetical protein
MLLPIGDRAFRRIYTIDEALPAMTAAALLTVLLLAVLLIIDPSGRCGGCIEWDTKDGVDGGGRCGTRFSERAGSEDSWAARSPRPATR